jgi:primosomal protein N' (replication factor Y)
VQKVEEMLGKAVPGARVIRMDSDTTSGSRSHWEMLGAFSRGEADILLGTQMVAKGHDFPDVTLVGILQADLGMSMPDFRAGERVFQLVLQAAGRSGRGADPGLVLVQAWAGDDPVLTSACRHDFSAFVETELEVRRSLGYPPFGRLARFVWSGGDPARVGRAASSSVPGPEGCQGVRLSGPSPAVIPRIGGRWRTSALARSESPRALGSYARKVLERFEGLGAAGVRLDVDIDPVDMM